MRMPPAGMAPMAIRALATIVRSGIAHTRTNDYRRLREDWLRFLRGNWEAAPRDEVVQPVYRAGAALTGRGGTCYFDGSTDSYGYDRIAMRRGRSARLLAPAPADVALPETWAGRFHERLTYPIERPFLGAHQHRFFLEIRRGALVVEIPIFDSHDTWAGPVFKAKSPPGGFPVNDSFPLRGYIAVDGRTAVSTLAKNLLVYLAQRGVLSPDEENSAITEIIGGYGRGAAARHDAYMKAKRLYVQPIGGRPGFGAYLARTVRFGRLDEDLASICVSPHPPARGWSSVKSLRISDPRLHRAVLDRIKSGQIECWVVEGNQFVLLADVEGVDEEREATAEARAKAPYSTAERREWRRQLVLRGESTEGARRKLARWINAKHMTRDEVEAAIASGRAPRTPRSKVS